MTGQATVVEIEHSDITRGVATNTLPETAVGAILPRWKRGGGSTEEGVLQLEERLSLAWSR